MNNMWRIWYLVFGFLALPGPSCSNSDNLALLLDTLKVIQRAVCNDETVALACPRGTTISIQVARYGKGGEDLGCPALSTEEEEATRNCKRPNVMQYSLLQTVVEACQKKPQCKFSTLPTDGIVDPCPKQRKFIEVAYKCRPYEFRSRTGCEGEFIKLSCNPHSRIAIFDAQYGRTAFEAPSCPQAQGVPDETCVTPHAVKTVIQQCLGRRRCQLAANSRTFNSSCNLNSKPYLKVIYACVPLGVLSEKYESAAERDEDSTTFDHSKALFDESEGENEKWAEPNADPALQPSSIDDTAPSTASDVEITTVVQSKKDRNEACVTPHAVKTVIQQCLGRRRCQLAANSRTFNSSCNLNSKPYLKVIYACVPLGVLSEKYESAAERDEDSTTFDHSKALFDESEGENEKWAEPNADPALQPSSIDDTAPSTASDVEITTVVQSKKDRNEELLHSDSILLLSLCIGFLVIIIIIGTSVAIKYYMNRKNDHSKNGDMYTTEAPNVFNDALSDIDNDADISHISGTFHDPMHPDMILYKNVPGSRGTLRAMKPLCTIYPTSAEANMYGNVDYVPSHTRDMAPRFIRSRSNEEEMEPNVMTSPRSLGAHSNNYYYG